LLIDWGRGDKAALDQLLPLVEAQLHRIAKNYLRRERPGHILQTTALINEAYLRLIDQKVSWQNRAHFFAIAAQMMRRILVDHARRQMYQKRGGGRLHVSLSGANEVEARPAELIALDEALKNLAEIGPQQARIIEMHYFGGLSNEEVAEAMGLSLRRVEREMRAAKAFLHSQMTE